MTIVVSPFTDFTQPSLGHRQLFLYELMIDDLRLCRVCPGASFVSRGRLRRHRFIVNSAGAMAVTLAPGSDVYGVIVEVPYRECTALEAHFAEAGLTKQRSGHAQGLLDALFRVEFWTSPDRRHGRAPALDVIQFLALGREFHFPEHYLSEIARWAGSEPLAAASGNRRSALRIHPTRFEDR